MTEQPVVLLVDDEPSVRRMLGRVLERTGCHVIEAENAAQALELGTAYPGPIDLLVTDVMLPDRTGVQLAYDLAERRVGLRVLFVSGYPDEDATRFGVTGPGYHFLQKPLDINHFAALVRDLTRPA